MVGSGSGLGKLRVYGNGSLGGDDDIGMVGGELHCIIRSLRRQTAMERRMANARPTCMEEVHAVESSSGQSGRGIGSLGSEGDGSDGRRRRK
jgi:hypothetical protein